MANTVPSLLTYQEAARYLGMPVGTLYCMVHEQRVPHFRLSRRMVRFSVVDLDQWIARHRVPVSARLDPRAVGVENT